MSTQPGYAAPAVTTATSLPRRGAGSAVLMVPVVSTGSNNGGNGDEQPGAAVVGAEQFLSGDAVAEIEAGLRALAATGEQ